MQSLELQFLGACIHGYYFHFSHCLWRKVQSLGLVEEYIEDRSVRQFIQNSTAIDFVPSSFVWVARDGLKSEIPDDDEMKSCSEYFDQTWMNGQFRPCMWNYSPVMWEKIIEVVEGPLVQKAAIAVQIRSFLSQEKNFEKYLSI